MMGTERRRKIIRIFDSHEAADRAEFEYWLSLTPQERIDVVGECVREFLALKNEPEQRLSRVYRVLEREAG